MSNFSDFSVFDSKRDSSADYLYSIISQSGKPTQVAAYNAIVDFLDKNRTADASKTNYDMHSDLDFGEWWATNDPYITLSNSDLAIYLEIRGRTHFSSLMKTDFFENVVIEMLCHSRTTEKLKIALALDFNYMPSIAKWLCDYRGGDLLPKVSLHMIPDEDDIEADDLTAPARRLVARTINASLENIHTAQFSSGETFIDKLHEDIVTRAFLDILLNINPPIRVKDVYEEAVSKHARRLYNFPDDMPDSWVIKTLM